LPAAGDLLAYLREEGSKRYLVVLNLGSKAATFDLPEEADKGTVEAGTDRGRDGDEISERVALRGHEGVLVRLSEVNR
jgi:hypothetical protein